MKKQSYRRQHNISLTEDQEDILQRVRAKHPSISLANMVMATAKALDTTPEAPTEPQEQPSEPELLLQEED